jgi:hypothetical protein
MAWSFMGRIAGECVERYGLERPAALDSLAAASARCDNVFENRLCVPDGLLNGALRISAPNLSDSRPAARTSGTQVNRSRGSGAGQSAVNCVIG